MARFQKRHHDSISPFDCGLLSAGGSVLRAGDGGNSSHKLTEKFRRIIGVEDVGATAAKMEFVQKTRYEGRGLTVGQGNDQDSLGKTVDQGQSFGLAGRGKALALEVHSIAGAGFVGGVRREQAVS